MGYTHYWEHDKFTEEEVATVLPMLQTILFNSNIPIADAWGERKGDYKCDHGSMSFNGLGDDSHETMLVEFTKKVEFEFCKTSRKPYDAVVVLCLIILAHYVPHFSWRSDGDNEDDRDVGAYDLFTYLQSVATADMDRLTRDQKLLEYQLPRLTHDE